MKIKAILIFFLLLSAFNFSKSQTSNQNLNLQLNLLRQSIFEENYNQFAKFVHPKVISMMGGKTKMIHATKTSIDRMKKDGFTYNTLNFKNPTKFIKKGNEIQFTITQEITMKTPKGKIFAEYSLIGVSNDKGKNWFFIDTAGKSKETMRKYLPFLSNDLIIKPKTRKFID